MRIEWELTFHFCLGWLQCSGGYLHVEAGIRNRSLLSVELQRYIWRGKRLPGFIYNSRFVNDRLCASVILKMIIIMPQSHLDVWCERMNTVWENHQDVQNWKCAPVNHPPTCSKRVSNVSKPTAHRVDTVLATFPKRFHTVFERVPACQTSIQRVLGVYVTCK